MKFYAYLFPAAPKPSRRLAGLSEEECIACRLITENSGMSDGEIASLTTSFNSQAGAKVSSDNIVFFRELMRAIMQDPMPCKMAIEYFCRTERIVPNYATVDIPTNSPFASRDPKMHDFNYLESIITLAVNNRSSIFTMLFNIGVQFTDKEVRTGLSLFIADSKLEYKQRIYDNIKFDKSAVFDMAQFKEDYGFDDHAIRCIEYAIWGTKRRMRCGDYSRRICPYLYSKHQMLGKTELGEAILGVLGELAVSITPAEYLDKSNHTIKEMYACLVDDIDSAERADIGAIKAALTMKNQAARKLYSNQTTNIQINNWPWFTSNKRVSQVFLDTTGNTRFLEIEITKKVFKQVKATDWLSLWRSIDETQSTLFTDDDWVTHTKVSENQRTQTYLDDFLNTSIYSVPRKIVPGRMYTPNEIFEIFKEYNFPLVSTYKLNPAKIARDIVAASFKEFTIEATFQVSNPRMVRVLKVMESDDVTSNFYQRDFEEDEPTTEPSDMSNAAEVRRKVNNIRSLAASKRWHQQKGQGSE